jgi:hypothetical protein
VQRVQALLNWREAVAKEGVVGVSTAKVTGEVYQLLLVRNR